MKKEFLDILRCPECGKSALRLEDNRILCGECNVSYEIRDGILDFLKNPSAGVKNERAAVDMEEYFQDEKGKRYKIDKDSIQRFREQFLLLPEGDDSVFFRRGGCFQPIAEASHRFYGTLERMELKGGERILNLGDGFGYASYKFAKKGCRVVALDISRYLFAAELYTKYAYFDRIFSDMHCLPFKEGVFDIVFCSAVLHHSGELNKVFSEIYRVLKKGGRVFIINESSRGIAEKENPNFKNLRERGYGDTAYTIPQWINAARKAGFEKINMEFLSLADDYIRRQENKGAERKLSLRFAYFLTRHRGLERFLLFLLKYPRIVLRPRSWRMICRK